MLPNEQLSTDHQLRIVDGVADRKTAHFLGNCIRFALDGRYSGHFQR